MLIIILQRNDLPANLFPNYLLDGARQVYPQPRRELRCGWSGGNAAECHGVPAP